MVPGSGAVTFSPPDMAAGAGATGTGAGAGATGADTGVGAIGATVAGIGAGAGTGLGTEAGTGTGAGTGATGAIGAIGAVYSSTTIASPRSTSTSYTLLLSVILYFIGVTLVIHPFVMNKHPFSPKNFPSQTLSGKGFDHVAPDTM